MGQDVADTARPRRRWLRFSLRGLLVLTLLLAIPLAWKANQVATERRNEAYLHQAGTEIERSAPWGPAWLVALVGPDWLSHVEVVRMAPPNADIAFAEGFDASAYPATTDEHLAAIAALPHVREVVVRGGQMTSAGLLQLARLPHLTYLEICDGELDEPGWKALGRPGRRHGPQPGLAGRAGTPAPEVAATALLPRRPPRSGRGGVGSPHAVDAPGLPVPDDRRHQDLLAPV